VTLTPDELDALARLEKQHEDNKAADTLHLRYYQGSKRIEQLGMAIPPKMRRFLVFANWGRVQVNTIESRQSVRYLQLPGTETTDERLRLIADASHLSQQLRMFQRDRMIFGRGFLSAGTNEDNPELPFVRVESPREIAYEVDIRREQLTLVGRFYDPHKTSKKAQQATLYSPVSTVWARRIDGKWVEVDRDNHGLGRLSIVMHLNRRMSGSWVGESEMTDILPLVDSVARSLTNLQFAQEAHGIPRMFMTGVSQGDFVDAQGQPVPKFEAYFNAIHTLSKSDAKVGQLTSADLKNFETAVNIYGKQAAVITGFPARYFGLFTTNPPAEGAMRADEAQLVEQVESQNDETGVPIGEVMSVAWRMATGDWPDGPINVDWFDPATPTVSQREDALSKRRAAGVLSREGYWDELGWSEARKQREREYFAAEDADPVLTKLLRGVSDDAALGA
jgi:hypothetical protein